MKLGVIYLRKRMEGGRKRREEEIKERR